MSDNDSADPDLWDEYQWERFLQKQDQKTEQYFSLFEQYADHPERDEIIARAMGWNQYELEEEDEDEWDDEDVIEGEIYAEAEVFDEDETFDDDSDDSEEAEGEEEDEDDEMADEEFEALQNSEIYIQSMELNRRAFKMVEERAELREHPAAVELATRVAICGAKLAAALCGDDYSEVGMTIAYLKRSLKAANDSLGAAVRLREAGLISANDLGSLTELIFPIRESLVDMMGEFRIELKRRRGEI